MMQIIQAQQQQLAAQQAKKWLIEWYCIYVY